jgi:hypothetical protein
MTMVVASSMSMQCNQCGFFFSADQDRCVTHPSGEIYTVHDIETREHHPCPNSGRVFGFPEVYVPVMGIYLRDAK